MEIVRSLAGYSYGRSDLVRRAMSKKKHDVMAKEREFFIHGTEGVDGAVKRGVPETVADRIFDEMMDFASYAFNKSHAACYAVLAYRTAYLKLYYPVEFMTALINSYMGGSDTVAKYVYTARRLGLAVLPPDVNRSRSRFSVEQVGKNEDGSKQLAIRFGLAAVKSVGGGVMEALVRERTERGAFRNFFDFCERTDGLNKRMLEALICAGCFDSMGARRSQLLAVYEQAFDGAMQQKKVKNAGQMSLFDLGGGTMLDQVSIKLPDIPELRSAILLAREREAAGLYLSGHPLDNFSQALDRFPLTVADLEEADGVTGVSDSSGVEVGGMLSSCKKRPAKNGNGMVGYAELEGVTGRVECVLFPRTLQQCGNLFYDDSPVAVRGKLNIREERTNSLLIEDLRPLAALQQTVFLRFASLTPDEMRRAAAFLRQYPGATPVVLFDAAKRIQKGVPENLYIEATDKFLQAAEAEFGKDNVKLK